MAGYLCFECLCRRHSHWKDLGGNRLVPFLLPLYQSWFFFTFANLYLLATATQYFTDLNDSIIQQLIDQGVVMTCAGGFAVECIHKHAYNIYKTVHTNIAKMMRCPSVRFCNTMDTQTLFDQYSNGWSSRAHRRWTRNDYRTPQTTYTRFVDPNTRNISFIARYWLIHHTF